MFLSDFQVLVVIDFELHRFNVELLFTQGFFSLVVMNLLAFCYYVQEMKMVILDFQRGFFFFFILLGEKFRARFRGFNVELFTQLLH